MDAVALRAREQTPSGLSGAQAARRLAQDGRNEVPPPRPPRVWRRVAGQLTDPLVALLLAAAVVTIALGDMTDTAVILGVVVVNTTIGVVQEIRADRAITALRQLSAPSARVRRDGADVIIPAAEVVRGDVLVLAQGDIVPADAELLEASQLTVDESALTGESVPVGRAVPDEVSAGTVVLTGRALTRVTRTGPHSALGRIAALVAATRPAATPLQRRLAELGRALGVVAVGLSALVMVLGVANGQPLGEMALAAVSLVVAAVPESLPAVVTLALALGAMRMARGHAIARRLHAVETLGSVTVLATDKTGTLTEGRMSVRRAVTAAGTVVAVRGRGYDPTGTVDPGPDSGVLDLARAVVLCNDAELRPPDADNPAWRSLGDPVEGALLAFAGRCGLDVAATRSAAPRVAEEPFDALTRRMITVHESVAFRYAVCKGAPEVVLDPGTTDCPAAVREALRAAAQDMADAGLRVLAVAGMAVDSREAGLRGAGLAPLGLVGIGDPIRPEAAGTTADLDAAGIRLVLITGDHPATARAIATEVGIPAAEVVSFDTTPAPDSVQRAAVFARVRPEQKLDIIAVLQGEGQVVAMTGDGVNDAPALRRADIGVAMGAGGTEVARQAADLVLTDDNLATVATAVHEGRRIYDNIRRFLRYALSGGLAEILVMLIGPAFGLAVPLLPAQILWINLLTHGLPGVALGAEPAEPGAMRRPPRPPDESVLGRGLVASVLLTGAFIAAVVLGVAVWAHAAGAPWQTMAFVTLGLAQLGVALAVRVPRGRGRPGNPALGVAVALSALLQLAAVGFGPLRALLHTSPLTWTQLAVCVAAAVLPGAAVATVSAVRRMVPDQARQA
ncbi:cation-transporting P-type ATPase [Luedemannella helvata]|uniref:HAD-IC family P-type ATPase n=1 Tax=Luedemannella helvata TaxID=349315 RepID=A0ABP4X855_9ACTN